MNATRKQLLVSGIIQLMIGSLCLIFGIAERVSTAISYMFTITSVSILAIWMGLWIGITGVLGILTKLKKSSRPMIGVYLGFSITSTVFASVMIICYSLSIILIYKDSDYYRRRPKSRLDYLMSILILVLSILEFGIGMWASICCCRVCGGRQSQTDAAGQVVYMQTQVGGPPIAHVMIQGPDGNHVAVPVQTSGPMMEKSDIPPHYSNVAVQQPQQNETKVPLV